MYALLIRTDKGSIADNACKEVDVILERHGLIRWQAGLYMGNVSAVDTMLAVQELGRKLEWLGKAVVEMKMLRITDCDDVMPLLNSNVRD